MIPYLPPMRGYDLILSLGTTCQTAYQIERKGLRKCAGPLDWFISPLSGTIKLLEDNFADFMKKENLEIIDTYENKNFVVKDTLYNVISYHDFPLSNESGIKTSDYEIFKNRLIIKINNFYAQLEIARSILFVMNGGEVDLDAYIHLSTLIGAIRKNMPFHMLICGYMLPGNLNSRPIEDITFYKFKKIKRFDNPADQWKGNDEEWDKCLNGVKFAHEL